MIEAVVNFAEGPDNGPALVLVHGQGMQWEDYAHVLPRSRSSAVSTCSPSIASGHGESSHDPALYSCRPSAHVQVPSLRKRSALLPRVGPFVGRIIAAWFGRQRR